LRSVPGGRRVRPPRRRGRPPGRPRSSPAPPGSCASAPRCGSHALLLRTPYCVNQHNVWCTEKRPTEERAVTDENGRVMGTPEGQAMVDLLWNPPPPPSRGPKQRLTLDRVVAAGIAVAGRFGATELSMRKVAQELGVGVMSLYTYVPGRDELFELMIDRAWGMRALPDRDLS